MLIEIWGSALVRQARRAATPIDDLGFVDLETVIIVCDQTRGFADGAVDVEHEAALAAHQVVMVVADSIFVPSNRPRGLDATDQALLDEDIEGVIDRLPRDRADLGAHGFGNVFGRGVRMCGNGLSDCKPLRGDMYAVITQQLFVER